MRTRSQFLLALAVAWAGLAPTGAARAGEAAKPLDPVKACREACREQHETWVERCIASHDPHVVTPSARGQCVEAGAEILQACLKACRADRR